MILTAYNEFDFASKAMSVGIQDYLLKPMRPDLLLQRIRGVLSRPAGGRAQPPQLWPSLACGMTFGLPQPLPRLPARVVMVLLSAPLSLEEGEALSAQAGPELRLECYGRRVVCYCPEGAAEPLEAAGRPLAEWTPLLPGRCRLARAGVGEAAAGPEELAESYRTARLAACSGPLFPQRLVCRYIPWTGEREPYPDHPLVARTIAIVESRYPEPLKLEGVAREQFVSPAYLGRIFHAHTGQTFRDYLTRVRLGHAARLLEEGASVSAAAAAVGYEDPNYFSRVYKKQFGYPPKEGRR